MKHFAVFPAAALWEFVTDVLSMQSYSWQEKEAFWVVKGAGAGPVKKHTHTQNKLQAYHIILWTKEIVLDQSFLNAKLCLGSLHWLLDKPSTVYHEEFGNPVWEPEEWNLQPNSILSSTQRSAWVLPSSTCCIQRPETALPLFPLAEGACPPLPQVTMLQPILWLYACYWEDTRVEESHAWPSSIHRGLESGSRGYHHPHPLHGLLNPLLPSSHSTHSVPPPFPWLSLHGNGAAVTPVGPSGSAGDQHRLSISASSSLDALNMP